MVKAHICLTFITLISHFMSTITVVCLLQEKEHPRVLIPELCRLFYQLGWVTGTGGGISLRQGFVCRFISCRVLRTVTWGTFLCSIRVAIYHSLIVLRVFILNEFTVTHTLYNLLFSCF